MNFFSLRFFLVALCLTLLTPSAWSETTEQNLAAVTSALDSVLKLTEGASVSFTNYQKKLQEAEAVAQKSQAGLNEEQRTQVEKILGYLRTARDLMQWGSKHRGKDGNYQYSENDKELNEWFAQYPFLRGAIMEKAPAGGTGVYDPDTALSFLWDRAEQGVERVKGDKDEE